MPRLPLIVLLVLFAAQNLETSEAIPLPSFSDIKTIVKYGWTVIKLIRQGYEKYKEFQAEPEDAQKRMLEDVGVAVKTLEDMKYRFEQQINVAVQTLIRRIPDLVKYDNSMAELHTHIVRVDALYETFVDYSKNRNKLKKKTLKDFVNTVTSHGAGNLIDSLDKINGLMLPGRTANLRESLLYLFYKKTIEGERERCNDNYPPQLKLYEIYAIVALTEIRAFTVLSFAYGMEAIWAKSSFEVEWKRAESRMILRCEKYMKAVQEAMTDAPRGIRRCDAKPQKRNDTFIELERLAQAFVLNELEISMSSCRHTCDTLPHSRQSDCVDQTLCQGEFPRCEGDVVDCWYAGGPVEICRPPPGRGSRRYTYFRVSSGTTYGKNNGCPNPSIRLNVKGYTHFWERCDYCACTCWEQLPYSPPERLTLLNLRPQIADPNTNWVLTGVRFVRDNGVIHIQIKQGWLLAGGVIEKGADEWKPIEKIVWGEKKGRTIEREYFLVNKGRRTLLKKDQDYAIISKNTKINLDEIMIDKQYVLGGVKFTKAGADQYEIAVLGRPFDFSTARVWRNYGDREFSAVSMRRWNNPPPEPYRKRRTEFDLGSPHDPLQSELNLPDSSPNQFIKFRPSAWDRDAGQTTVPFFDGQPVTMNPPLPLSGISLFHKGHKGFGGFIALEVIGLDISSYLDTEVPPYLSTKYQTALSAPSLTASNSTEVDNATITTDGSSTATAST